MDILTEGRQVSIATPGRSAVVIVRPEHMLLKNHLRYLGASLAIVVLAGIALAQTHAAIPDLPDEFAKLRESQQIIAHEADVTVVQHDRGRRWVSSLKGVPAQFRETRIDGRDDAEAVVQQLYPYYGLFGAESLRFERAALKFGNVEYRFRQYIDDIETPALLTIVVDESTSLIVRMKGGLHIDSNLERQPRVSREEAIALADGLFRGDSDGDELRRADIIYLPWGEDGAFSPHWRIGVPMNGGTSAPQSAAYAYYVVAPDGSARSMIQSSHQEPFP